MVLYRAVICHVNKSANLEGQILLRFKEKAKITKTNHETC